MIRLNHHINIPQDIKLLHQLFKDNNKQLYLVGGCVRDSILGIIPKDYDLVTDMLPDDIIEMLQHQSFIKNILETGKSFGVINVITVYGNEYEIATMREDSIDSDGRRPDSVILGATMETDCARRDIRSNALYYDLETNEVIDLVGGIEDLKNNVIRTVGNPDDRFREDKLRRLRLIRFSARFNSLIDPEADKSLLIDSNLDGISNERIRDEFLKGIKSAKSVVYFLDLLNRYDLFKYIFKGLQKIPVSRFIEERDPIILISYLLIYDKAEVVMKKLNVLTYSVDEIRQISFLMSLCILSTETAYNIKKQHSISNVTDEQIIKYSNLIGVDLDLILTFLNYKLSVSGQQVMDSGITNGLAIGQEIMRLETELFKIKLHERKIFSTFAS